MKLAKMQAVSLKSGSQVFFAIESKDRKAVQNLYGDNFSRTKLRQVFAEKYLLMLSFPFK
jgi:hypothetical protein